MKRTLFRRGSALNRFVSLWVALAFVMSLSTVAVAEPSAVSDGSVPVVESTTIEPAAPQAPAQDQAVPAEAPAPAAEVPPAASEPAAPQVPAQDQAVPAEVQGAVLVSSKQSKVDKPRPAASVEAEPVTASPAKATVVAATVSSDSIVTPVIVSGNPSLGANGVRIDESDLPASGTVSFPVVNGSITATLTITVYNNGLGEEFDFVSTWPVTSVVAKGGPLGANVYAYSPATMSDTGLHTPMNPTNGKYSDISHLDFYFGTPAEVTAYKFEDLDRDGVRDEGEPFLSGWDFQLKSGSIVVDSGTTDGDGKVVFDGLAAGSYTVSEVEKDGWLVTNATYPVAASLAAGEEKVVEIGNARVSGLTVLKFQDLNANGVRDEGEPSLSGWTIRLLKGGEVVDFGVTDDTGIVVFGGLVPGSYVVTEMLTDGWFSTTSLPIEVSLVGGQDQLVNIGNAQYPDLSVLKFHDIDRDGVRDEGEPALAGWTFQLKIEGEVIYSAVTGDDGIARFVNVEPGAYSLYEVLHDSWFVTRSMPVAVVMTANVDQSLVVGNSLTVTKSFRLTYPALPDGAALFVEYSVDGSEPVLSELLSLGEGVYGFQTDLYYSSTISGRWIVSVGGELVPLASFGPEVLTEDLTNTFVYQSVIAGAKYSDDDGDGARDAGEPGLAGWTVNLYRIVDGERVFYGSTVTGEGGAYAFVGLPPATYMVEEVQQTGWTQTDGPVGSVTISGSSQQVLGLNFGNTQLAPFTEPNTSIDKRADVTLAEPGDVVTYTLTYANTGDSDIPTVTITDDYDERYMTPVDVGDGVVADGAITWVRTDVKVGEERTITYTLRVSSDMPTGNTVVDNTAVIEPFGDTATWQITVENPFLPFTEDDDVLPFTGGELALLVLALVLAVSGGIALRRAGRAF